MVENDQRPECVCFFPSPSSPLSPPVPGIQRTVLGRSGKAAEGQSSRLLFLPKVKSNPLWNRTGPSLAGRQGQGCPGQDILQMTTCIPMAGPWSSCWEDADCSQCHCEGNTQVPSPLPITTIILA